MNRSSSIPPLLGLPAELIHHILSFLPPVSLSSLSQTCHLLHNHAQNDQLWYEYVQSNLPATKLRSASPASSYRELWLSHYPYWFLPRYRIWFSDSPHTGKLLIARYSHSRQTIEAYTLAAERGHSNFEFWSWNPDVIIHTFEPKVQLDLNQPVLKLDAMSLSERGPASSCLQNEINMSTHSGGTLGGVYSMFMLTRPLPVDYINSGTQCWPPQKLPAESRTRNATADGFRGSGHRPSKLSEVSEHTFRIRRWIDFGQRLAGVSMHVGEGLNTYATLPPEAYMPTKLKPWRGIWCGDYSGHGCEFLAVLQPDEPVELPDGALEAMERRRRSASFESDSSWGTVDSLPLQEEQDPEWEHAITSETTDTPDMTAWSLASRRLQRRVVDVEQEDVEEAKYSGQLMAIKLTGDPNIPRGEYTFIAPDIGREGTVRVAEEEIFRGARVVQSVGHIAARGYIQDEYIPSQLILLSNDTLAQYWEAFGHVSFYKRVDIDKFLHTD